MAATSPEPMPLGRVCGRVCAYPPLAGVANFLSDPRRSMMDLWRSHRSQGPVA